ncbi:MAG: hypothetical protein LC620_07470 [Halobacteriales archaeon]|nr:hypothetical protein [Halobacteriales archaeon]
MDPGAPAGRLPDGVVNAIIAFTFATFLLTVALWPSGSHPAVAVPDAITPPSTATGGGDVFARENIVGKEPYSGPVTATEVVAACAPAKGSAALPCYKEKLKALLVGKGAIAAFDALDNMTVADPGVSGQGHALAHELGRFAFFAYGSIEETLKNCSYKAFQGCFHGALESYFESLATVGKEKLEVCPGDDAFRLSTCVHGIGHGLMLYTNANVTASLTYCDWLADNYQQSSCWSGVIMENLVGYYETKSGAAHHHGNATGPPGYMVSKPGDPYYPCSSLEGKYKATCWQQQADYILYANGSDFEAAARICDNAPDGFASECRRSLGRDASGWYRDVPKAVRYCSYGNQTYRPSCIRGLAAEVVLYYFSPAAGITACREVPEQDKQPCYNELAVQGRGMVGNRMGEICATAEEAHVADCRSGAGLGAT